MDALVNNGSVESELESNGQIHGLAIGIVTNNEDPDGLARVRVRLTWQAEGEESFWARIITPMAMADKGVFFLPEVGDEVMVGFERGDMSHPYIMGSVWNGQATPPETNADGNNDVRMIRTRSGHELRFFDGDPPSVELKLEDGKHLLIDDQGVTLEDDQGNLLKIETSSGAITIESSSKLNLKSQTISIEAGASMDIKASGTLTLKGAMVQIN